MSDFQRRFLWMKSAPKAQEKIYKHIPQSLPEGFQHAISLWNELHRTDRSGASSSRMKKLFMKIRESVKLKESTESAKPEVKLKESAESAKPESVGQHQSLQQ